MNETVLAPRAPHDTNVTLTLERAGAGARYAGGAEASTECNISTKTLAF